MEHADSPISLERLSELSQGDREFESILLTAFEEEMVLHVAQLGEALTDENAASVRSLAHGLKGASANVGADETRAICVVLEQIDIKQDPQAASELLAQLRTELDRVQAFTRKYLGEG